MALNSWSFLFNLLSTVLRGKNHCNWLTLLLFVSESIPSSREITFIYVPVCRHCRCLYFWPRCNMLVSVCGQHVWACFHCFWVTWGWKRMACVRSSLSFEELHTVSTKTTLFHYPRQALDAGLQSLPTLDVVCCLFWVGFCFSVVTATRWVWCFNDWWYLCPFWGIYVLSFSNISRLLVVLWVFSIFILVLKYLKHFMCVYVYGCLCVCMSVCVFVYVCLCVWALMFMCAYGFHSFGPTVFSW